MEANNGKVKVELVDLGEGISGDYDPDDPEDIALLRFDVYDMEDGDWEPRDCSSYCTQIPVDSPEDQLKACVEYILHFYLALDPKASSKKLGQELSWIGLENGKVACDLGVWSI